MSSSDGTRIVTDSEDKTARVWDARSGAQLALLKGSTGQVWSAAWSPDGARIVTACGDNTARMWEVWPFLTADTVLYADISALRSLTADERKGLFIDVPTPPQPAVPHAAAQDVSKITLAELQTAAAAGNPYAHRRLAEMYERGDGLPQDLEKALFHHAIEARLFELAGNEDEMQIAAARRGSIARALTPQAAVRIAQEAMDWKPAPAPAH